MFVHLAVIIDGGRNCQHWAVEEELEGQCPQEEHQHVAGRGPLWSLNKGEGSRLFRLCLIKINIYSISID